MLFDVSCVESFANLEIWYDRILSHLSADIDFPMIVLGNKIDLDEDMHVVEDCEVEAWCKRHGNLQYIKTSAKNDIAVDKAFYTIVQVILDVISEEELMPFSQGLNMQTYREVNESECDC